MIHVLRDVQITIGDEFSTPCPLDVGAFSFSMPFFQADDNLAWWHWYIYWKNAWWEDKE